MLQYFCFINIKKSNTMKNITKIQSVLLLAFFLTLPFILITQEEEKKEKTEKTVKIKTIKEVDGKKIVKDTTFTVSGDEDVKQVVKMYTKEAESDSLATMMIDVQVGDDDADAPHYTHKKKIIIKKDGGDEEVFYVPHGSHSKVMKIKTEDGDDEKIVIVSPHGKHKVIKWETEDGKEFEIDYDYDYDYEVDMESFHEDMAELEKEMQQLQIEILDEQGHLREEIIELHHLKELEHLEELEKLKEMEVIVVPPEPHAPHFYHDYTIKHRRGMEVTDAELRDAGIKNKPDRLELDEIDVEKEDGVVDLSFTMVEEGNPKVDVYNIYGDKVFSGKPALMNSKYQIKMDLSKKQYGNYYMMISLGSASKTLRLEL
jgi:hypothetical protein